MPASSTYTGSVLRAPVCHKACHLHVPQQWGSMYHVGQSLSMQVQTLSIENHCEGQISSSTMKHRFMFGLGNVPERAEWARRRDQSVSSPLLSQPGATNLWLKKNLGEEMRVRRVGKHERPFAPEGEMQVEARVIRRGNSPSCFPGSVLN
ncbi:unnamed protein product [Pleuronectes platessa]|uniref:Uncharacterized protein n=1 Tax=Pleuronectes platessa TaxID=8262 RepID=A0A9N7UZ93_PLEPL|nr:unnamed protein product [Pleuronectes platessa]